LSPLAAVLATPLQRAVPLALPTGALDPDQLPSLDELHHWSTRLTQGAMVAAIGAALGLLLHWPLLRLAMRLFAGGDDGERAIVRRMLGLPSRLLAVALGVSVADSANHLLANLWEPLARFALPALFGWTFYAMVKCFGALVEARSTASDDSAKAMAERSLHTRVTILSRSAGLLIVAFTVSLILLRLPGMKHIGATLLASAGLLGLAVGAAAQPALKSLIGGLQIALTEPFRIGDYVVVDGEAGRVEDIRLSYVVIRTLDERRLVVPTPRFLDSTFQNWTRVGGITGNVVLPIKPGTPIAPIRAAFEQLLAQRPEWDGRSAYLMVTDAKIGMVEIMLWMSTSDPARLADLRLAMREAMLEWLREEMPEALCRDAAVVRPHKPH
jgi:xanthosine utilization system XapX-like protein